MDPDMNRRHSPIRKSAALLIAALLLGCAGGLTARGDAMYSVTNLGALSPVGLDSQGHTYLNQFSSAPYPIHQDLGQRDRIGYSALETARRYEPSGPNAGQFTDIGANVPKGAYQVGSAVNPASSKVIGVTGDDRAVVLTNQGTFLTDGKTATRFDVPAGYGVVAVNASGQAAANLGDGYSSSNAAIVKAGTATPIVTPNGQLSEAVAINASGQISGRMWDNIPGTWTENKAHAFVTQNGKVVDLGTLGGAWSRATAINDGNQVVGVSDTGTQVNMPGYVNWKVPATHAFLATNGTMKDLGTIGNDSFSVALGFGSKGQVLGYSSANSSSSYNPHDPPSYSYGVFLGSSDRAFLYDGKTMLDINKLVIPPPSGLVSIDRAFAINDKGQILAEGYYNTTIRNTLLLTPISQPQPTTPPELIPEPATWVFYGLCLAGFSAHRLRAKARAGRRAGLDLTPSNK